MLSPVLRSGLCVDMTVFAALLLGGVSMALKVQIHGSSSSFASHHVPILQMGTSRPRPRKCKAMALVPLSHLTTVLFAASTMLHRRCRAMALIPLLHLTTVLFSDGHFFGL